MRKIATITAVKRRKQNFFLGLCISLEIFESFSFWENVTSTTTTTTITTTVHRFLKRDFKNLFFGVYVKISTVWFHYVLIYWIKLFIEICFSFQWSDL